MKMTKDRTCGLDRYESSPSFGEVVVPIILMWEKPGQGVTSVNGLTGALPHDFEVTITKQKKHNGAAYSYIEGTQDGNRQVGWVRNTMLLEAGKNEEGITNAD